MKRVLVVCDVTGHGGVSTYLGHLGQVADRYGWRIEFLLDDGEGAAPVRAYLRDQGATPLTAPLRRDRVGDAVVMKAFDTVLEATRPKIVHAVLGSPRSALVPREVALTRGFPLIITEQYVAADLEVSDEIRLRIAETYSRAFRVVFVSHENSRTMRDAFGLVPARSVVIGNSVPVAGWRLERASPLSRRVLTVARLAQQKGLEVLLSSISLLSTPGLVFAIAGDGELRDELQARSVRLVDASVEWLGWRADVPHLLQQSDLFVLPSRSEGQPFALLEAMAHGVPCIASAVSGIPEALDHGRVGTLVPAGDPRALAEAIDGFYRDPGRHHEMAALASDRVAQHFCEARNGEHLERIWRAAIE